MDGSVKCGRPPRPVRSSKERAGHVPPIQSTAGAVAAGAVRDPSGVVERRISSSLGHSRGDRSLGSGNRSLRSRVGRRSSGHTAGGAGLASGVLRLSVGRRSSSHTASGAGLARGVLRLSVLTLGSARREAHRRATTTARPALLASTAEKSAGRSESRQKNDLVHRLKTLSEGANSKGLGMRSHSASGACRIPPLEPEQP